MAIWRVPVEIQNTMLPSSCYNIWHLRTTTGADGIDAALGELHDFYATNASRLALNSVVKFPEALVNVVTSEEAPLAAQPADVVATGTSMAPGGISALITWKTTIRARRGRGRTFFGPITKAMLSDDGLLLSTEAANLQVAVDALVNESNNNLNGWAFGVYGQQDKGVPAVKVLRDFVSGEVRRDLGHLRRRRD